jgi:hypothetical protein
VLFFVNLSILIFLIFFSGCFLSCAQLLNNKFNFSKTIKGSDGTLTWELDYTSNKLVVSGSADKDTPFTCTRISNIDFDEVLYIELHSGITALGDYAFSGFSKVKNITIPSSVVQIDSYAFGGWHGYTITLDWTSSDSTSRSLSGLNNTSATVLYSDGTRYK